MVRVLLFDCATAGVHPGQSSAIDQGATCVGIIARERGATFSLPYPYRIEIGPWFEAGKKIGSGEALTNLSLRHSNSEIDQHPYCIYIHVPFCVSRCNYCALYTYSIQSNVEQILDEYLSLVEDSITTHPNAGASFPPTTVHFGGGTPLFLGQERFARLTAILRKTFGDSQDCEWAVETTTSSIDSTIATDLRRLRFQRIHLGIQTLDNDLRKAIGRRESGETAIEKIKFLNDHGFMISVDLILGFQGQTEFLLERDLRRLYEAGVRMLSVCELRNLRSGKNTPDAAIRNYRLWCCLWDFMERCGLMPIHIGQFGRSTHDNLYYTHPARGEDCIALGPYAHGSAGRMIYANKLLRGYYRAIREGASPIRFAVLYSPEVQNICDLEKELLAHRIWSRTVNEFRTASREFCRIWDCWMKNDLISFCEKRKCFQPTSDGSWFIGNMAWELRQLAGRI